jgi:hypothetical protein
MLLFRQNYNFSGNNKILCCKDHVGHYHTKKPEHSYLNRKDNSGLMVEMFSGGLLILGPQNETEGPLNKTLRL